MNTAWTLLLGVVGGVLLCFGADYLVRGAAALARASGSCGSGLRSIPAAARSADG